MILTVNLIKDLQKIKEYVVEDKLDAHIIIFGKPGSGKSTLAMNIARFFNKDFTVDFMAFEIQDVGHIILDLMEYKLIRVMITDENVFRKRDKQLKVNRILTDVYDRIRGLNIINIWCVPTIQELDNYLSIERTFNTPTCLFLQTIFDGETKERYGRCIEQLEVFRRLREFRYGKLEGYVRHIYKFKWDFKGIEDLIHDYAVLKEQSIKNVVKKLDELDGKKRLVGLRISYGDFKDLARQCDLYQDARRLREFYKELTKLAVIQDEEEREKQRVKNAT